MTLIDFIQTMDIDVGWTKAGYGEIKGGKVTINVPRFIAKAIIHEYVHHTMPHTKLDEDSCSLMVQKKAKLIVDKLSESALRDIADEVCKAMVKHVRSTKHIAEKAKALNGNIEGTAETT